MFKKFHGYNLVELYHQKKSLTRFNIIGQIKTLVAVIASIIVVCLPTECFGIVGLNPVEQRVIAIFVFAALMWLSEAIPSWATSVMIIVLLLLTVSTGSLKVFSGDVDAAGEFVKYDNLIAYKSIMACFADPTIMLFIGGFILAIGMTKTKLDVVFAKYLLSPFGRNSNNVLLGFILVTALFSSFMSNTATAAMMLAFLAPVLKNLPADGKGRISLAMAIPLGANIGGISTPIGTPPNTIAIGYLNETLGITIGFGEWMARMVPFVLVMLFAGWFLLRWLFPFKQKTIDLEIEGEFHKTKRTWIVIATFLVTVVLWCWPSKIGDLDVSIGLNSYVIALIPMAVFAFTGILTRRDLEEINWSVLWMVAGGFALGVALNSTGLSKHLVASIPFSEWSPLMVLLVSGLVCYGFSNFISHSAAASLLVPVLGVVAGAMQGAGVLTEGGVARLLISVAIAASVSMILPISTPPNAIAHSTGMIEQKDMIKVGVIMGILGLVIGYVWLFIAF